jgi:hypothetical protein
MRLIKFLILVITFSAVFTKKGMRISSKQDQVVTLINKNAPCVDLAKVLDSKTIATILGSTKPVNCKLNCAAANFNEFETNWGVFLLYAQSVQDKAKGLLTALGEKNWAWKDC